MRVPTRSVPLSLPLLPLVDKFMLARTFERTPIDERVEMVNVGQEVAHPLLAANQY